MSDEYSVEDEEIECEEVETAVDKKVSEQELVEKYQKRPCHKFCVNDNI